MNQKQKEEYIKKVLDYKYGFKSIEHINIDDFEGFPSSLFKYRFLNDYTKDSLENNYLYLSKAENLDDQFECFTNFDVNDKEIMKISAKEIANVIDAPKEIKKQIIKMCEKCFDRKNQKIDYSLALQNLPENYLPNDIPKEDAVKAIEQFSALCVGAIEGASNNDSFKNMMVNLVKAREKFGIGSLSETNKSQVMWEMYSDHYEGVCIEYDCLDDLNIKLNSFPVIYGNKSKTNFIYIFVGIILEKFIEDLSKGSVSSKENEYQLIKFFITKYKEWSFQKEWRVIGQAEEKYAMPPIKAIYLGKRINEENRNFILRLADEKKFEVYQQIDNYKNLAIEFKRIN